MDKNIVFKSCSSMTKKYDSTSDVIDSPVDWSRVNRNNDTYLTNGLPVNGDRLTKYISRIDNSNDEGFWHSYSKSSNCSESCQSLSNDKDDWLKQQEDFVKRCKQNDKYPVKVRKDRYRRSRSKSPVSERRRHESRSRRSRSCERYRVDKIRESSLSGRYKKKDEKSVCERDKYDRSHCNDDSKLRERRRCIVEKWRNNNCADDKESQHQFVEMMKLKPQEIIEWEKQTWIRSAPAELYYRPEPSSQYLLGTDMSTELCTRFENELVKRGERVRNSKPMYEPPPRKRRLMRHKCCPCSDSDSDSCSSDDEDGDNVMEELERKRNHPDRLHAELWHNEPGEMNDGPLCRCSAKAKRSGIRHNIYAGELSLTKCRLDSNNANSLYHYRITISPPTNFLIKTPTIIVHDEHEYIFEGFSMFSHKPLENLPFCKVIRFNIEYTILYVEEKRPENFTIKELNLFYDFLFKEILELVDLDLRAVGDKDGCAQFHFMPRFVRELPKNGKEVLSMNEVLLHLLDSSKLLVDDVALNRTIEMPKTEWQNMVDEVKGMIVTYPGKKPCSLRVDQLDRDQSEAPEGGIVFPEIIHFGIRPPQLSYAGNPDYQKAWREYMKFRHLLANMPKVSFEDKRKLEVKENSLHEMRSQSKMKRDVTVAISSQGFYRTGIMCDIVQHAMLIPVLVSHLRFHRSLDVLETNIKYQFKNRGLLQLALTHPSYRENFGTNPDHARNSLTNCGIRQPEYGDRRIHYMNTRKRGINTLINIMSRFGKLKETESNITHNERLEFLGDAVVEFVTSIHLFHMFPRLEEGGLATYRAAIVQNQHLAVLAKVLRLDEFMLYAHGSDLCHDLELRHAMANCFEALMGALFLDGGITIADSIFGLTLFGSDGTLMKVWFDYPPHPLQDQEPEGDRKWIEKFKILQDLTKFEKSIGIEFSHIRLLARAFTDRSVGYTNLTMGSNQRLEFLGDTVLQLIASEYLYKFFPEHHEGHLSLLRSSLVNNRTQAVVCDDLGMSVYAIYANPKAELKTKDRADLLESFLGALYIDKGMEYCKTFCNICFFPRLQHFIMHQDWNDPKSKLQQCCLTLRTMEGGEPEIPVYKVIQCMGPTNTRLYTVAVYFKERRLAQATGHSIQQAEMNAAKKALQHSQSLFPQLDHQRRIIAKSLKKQTPNNGGRNKDSTDRSRRSNSTQSRKRSDRDDSTGPPEQYRLKRSKLSHSSDRAHSYSRRGDRGSPVPPLSYQISDHRNSCHYSSRDGKCSEKVLSKHKNTSDGPSNNRSNRGYSRSHRPSHRSSHHYKSHTQHLKR